MSETKKKSPSGKFTGGPAMSRELLLEQEVNKLEAKLGVKETEVTYYMSEATFYKSRSTQLDKYIRDTERELAQSQLELQLALLKVETVTVVLTKMQVALTKSSPKCPRLNTLRGRTYWGATTSKENKVGAQILDSLYYVYING